MAQVHHFLDASIETVLFIASPTLQKTSSSNIKKIKEKLENISKK